MAPFGLLGLATIYGMPSTPFFAASNFESPLSNAQYG
jgi:hypothetical protein